MHLFQKETNKPAFYLDQQAPTHLVAKKKNKNGRKEHKIQLLQSG